jgi:hypothetical protein
MLTLGVVFGDCKIYSDWLPTSWCVVIYGVWAIIILAVIVRFVVITWFPKLMSADMFTAWRKSKKS